MYPDKFQNLQPGKQVPRCKGGYFRDSGHHMKEVVTSSDCI